MKLPRWLVLSLISVSVIVAIGSGGWFWITWPERTLAECQESNDWQRLCDPEFAAWLLQYFGASKTGFRLVPENLDAQPRSIVDYLLAREEFEGGRDIAMRYVVERGRIKDVRVTVTSNSWDSIRELWRRAGDLPGEDLAPDALAP